MCSTSFPINAPLTTCVSLQSPFFFSPAARHAGGSREVFDGGLPYLSAFLLLAPPPRWRYAEGFDGGLPYCGGPGFLQLTVIEFCRLLSLAVQGCESGF